MMSATARKVAEFTFFLTSNSKRLYYGTSRQFVEHSGEFLDPTSRQLPHSRVTVAVTFNVKREAMQKQGSPAPIVSTDLPSPAHFQVNPLLSPQQQLSRLANDFYAEWDTMETIQAVEAAIAERHDVVLVEADEHVYERLRETKPDFVFNMAEGLYGAAREAQVPTLLEMLSIPYLGSDPLTLSICLDKGRAKEVLAYYGIPTAPFAVVRSMDEFLDVRVRFPAMVKPLHEGSSKGIYNSCLVKTPEELQREIEIILSTYYQPALVEEFLPGREFTVAILGNGQETRVLPIVEIRFDSLPVGVNPIYSYEAKWIWDTAENPLEIFECPASIDLPLEEEIKTVCLDAYRILACRDWARIDVRLDRNGRPAILEVNPLPGILPKPEDNSCFPKAARAAGISYNELIQTVLEIAFERCGFSFSAVAHSREVG
jgi:D-alanine-D-alanine ligase